MKFEFELRTGSEIDLASKFMRSLLGLREEASKGNLESPSTKVSDGASDNREDKGGSSPPKSDSTPDKSTVYSVLKTKVEINEDAVTELCRKFSSDGKAKFSHVPTENYKAFLKALKAIV